MSLKPEIKAKTDRLISIALLSFSDFDAWERTDGISYYKFKMKNGPFALFHDHYSCCYNLLLAMEGEGDYHLTRYSMENVKKNLVKDEEDQDKLFSSIQIFASELSVHIDEEKSLRILNMCIEKMETKSA